MKVKVKVKMEKEVREKSSKSKIQASPPKPAMIFLNTANRTNTERRRRRLVSDLKHSSFAANLSAVANQEVEDDGESLPTEDPYEQAASHHQRAKAITESRPSTSLGNYDLLVLSNAASLAVFRQVSKEVVVAPEESLQKRGKAEPLKLVKQDKPIGRDVSDGCREDKWFKKKYVRKKSKNTRIKTVEGQYRDSGVKDKTKIKIQSRDENQEIARKSSLITHIFGTKNQEIPKRKRSQRKRKPGSGLGTRREENERDCDQNGSNAGDPEIALDEDIHADKPEEEEEENTIFEADFNQTVLESDIAEEDGIISDPEGFLSLLEEAEREDVSDASSLKWWSFTTRPRTSRGIRHVQWSKKTKRDRRNVEQPQEIEGLLLAVEAITHQLVALHVSMEEKSSYGSPLKTG